MTFTLTTWRQAVVASLAGVAIGGACALSPMTLFFGFATVALFSAAGAGLRPRERKWIIALLSVALVLRLLALVAFVLFVDHDRVAFGAFFGDGLYAKERSLWLRSIWMGIPVSPANFREAFSPYGWTGYHYVLGFLQVLMGPLPYGIHLLNMLAFLSAVLLLHRLVRTAYGPLPALTALAIMLFMPTLFLWSISELKESSVLLAHVVAVVACIAALRAKPWWERVAAAAISGAAILSSSALRNAASVFLVGGLTLGLVARLAAQNIWSVSIVVVLTSALAAQALRSPDVQRQIEERIKYSALIHMGHVNTRGYGYKLLDDRFYAEGNTSLASMTLPEGMRFVVRAMVGFVVVPLPWQSSSVSALVYLPQQLVWYALVLFSFVGFVEGFQRDRLVTLLLTSTIVVGGGIIALNSGNIGTMVRLRDMIVPFVICLGALGACSSVARLRYSRDIQPIVEIGDGAQLGGPHDFGISARESAVGLIPNPPRR